MKRIIRYVVDYVFAGFDNIKSMDIGHIVMRLQI